MDSIRLPLLRLSHVTVLIDQPMWPAHDTLWSHLVSDDSLDELHAFAKVHDIPRRAFDLDHYDVPAERFADLLRGGAEAVSNRDLIRRLAASGLRISHKERRDRAGR